MLHIVKGGDSNFGLTNRNALLLESVRYQDPKWRLGCKCLHNEESLNILRNVFKIGGIMPAMSPTD